MHLTAATFGDGAEIPARFTCDGVDVSPALAWSDPPEGTRAFALVLEDPDAPRGTWVHWTLYDLPGSDRGLDEHVPPLPSLPSGARQGRNDFGRIGYGGPCPPPGRVHHYVFRLMALDTRLGLAAGATRAELERATHGHVLAQAALMGRYGRRARA